MAVESWSRRIAAMRPHHEQRGGMPTRRRAIRTGLFALACTLYLCNGLEDSRTDTATPTGNPTSTPAALTQETPTAVSGSTLQRTSAPSSNQGANFTFPTAYMESWELAASVAESLLANSEPGFTTSLNYSRSNIITSIAVARVSPATPEAGKSTLSNPRQSCCLPIMNPGSHGISLVRAECCPPL